MGGVNSNQQTIEQFQRDYEEVKTQYDEHYGEIMVYRKISNPSFMVMAKERFFNEEATWQKFLKRVKKRKLSHGDNVAKLLTVLRKHTPPPAINHF